MKRRTFFIFLYIIGFITFCALLSTVYILSADASPPLAICKTNREAMSAPTAPILKLITKYTLNQDLKRFGALARKNQYAFIPADTQVVPVARDGMYLRVYLPEANNLYVWVYTDVITCTVTPDIKSSDVAL